MPPSESRSLLGPNEVLLVKIQRDKASTCPYKLEVFDLDNAPTFAALSYVRGTEMAMKPVRCLARTSATDDTLTVRSIAVPSSLEMALKQLSALVSDGKNFLGYDYVWADALSIDQSNDAEKESQILNMYHIYGVSDRLLICMGETRDGSKEAIAVIEAISSMRGPEDDNFSQYASQALDWYLTKDQLVALARELRDERRLYKSDTIFQNAGLPEMTHPVWLSFAALYTRSWFTRLWTLQEAWLASRGTVICGDSAIEWSAVRHIGVRLTHSLLMYVAWSSLTTLDMTRVPRAAAVRFFQDDHKERNFRFLLVAAGEREVSRDHDRVYAILGLAPAEVRARVIVQYSAPLSRVYTSLSKAVMEKFGIDAILNRKTTPHKSEDLPTWCPDFRFSLEGLYIPQGRCPSIKIPPEVYFDTKDERAMVVAGAELDIVAKVVGGYNLQWGSSTGQTYGPEGDAARIVRWMDACQHLIESHRPGCSRDEIQEQLAVALLAENPSHEDAVFSWPENATQALQKIKLRMEKLAQGDCKENVEPLTDEVAEETSETFDRLHRVWRKNEVFFATTAGRFGVGIEHIREDDKLVALFGAEDVYALRDSLQGRHEFISQCYVTELSDGKGTTKEELLTARQEFTLV